MATFHLKIYQVERKNILTRLKMAIFHLKLYRVDLKSLPLNPALWILTCIQYFGTIVNCKFDTLDSALGLRTNQNLKWDSWKNVATLKYWNKSRRKLYIFLCVSPVTLLRVITVVVLHPPARELSSKVANLTERKNPHTPVYGVKEFVCLSVTNFEPNYLRTGRSYWDEFFQDLFI